jgi:hypothetical protein
MDLTTCKKNKQMVTAMRWRGRAGCCSPQKGHFLLILLQSHPAAVLGLNAQRNFLTFVQIARNATPRISRNLGTHPGP